jgi:hypothetical protein
MTRTTFCDLPKDVVDETDDLRTPFPEMDVSGLTEGENMGEVGNVLIELDLPKVVTDDGLGGTGGTSPGSYISKSTIKAFLRVIKLWHTNELALHTLSFLEIRVTFPKGDDEGHNPAKESSELLSSEADEDEDCSIRPGMTRKFSRSQSIQRRAAKRTWWTCCRRMIVP